MSSKSPLVSTVSARPCYRCTGVSGYQFQSPAERSDCPKGLELGPFLSLSPVAEEVGGHWYFVIWGSCGRGGEEPPAALV